MSMNRTGFVSDRSDRAPGRWKDEVRATRLLQDDERMERLFHIARVTDWEQARRDGAYRVSSLGKLLDDEGFIHLSFAHQVKGVATRSTVA
jgi:Protein of unknown function (DUF952)